MNKTDIANSLILNEEIKLTTIALLDQCLASLLSRAGLCLMVSLYKPVLCFTVHPNLHSTVWTDLDYGNVFFCFSLRFKCFAFSICVSRHILSSSHLSLSLYCVRHENTYISSLKRSMLHPSHNGIDCFSDICVCVCVSFELLLEFGRLSCYYPAIINLVAFIKTP